MHIHVSNSDVTNGGLKTKLATSVSKILGNTELVQKLDKARLSLRMNPRSHYHIQRYEDSLDTVKTQVLALHNKLTLELAKWDTKFVVAHGYEPTHDHYKSAPQISSVYMKKHRSSELLKHWGITLHLL